MTVFGERRGVFASMGIDTSGGKGVQVTIPGGNPVGSSSLVTSFSAQQRENFSFTQCLNGGIFLYTFGHDPGASSFSLSVTSFLNSCAGDVGAALKTALDVYRAGRLSVSKQKATLSVGNGALRGYLIGQSVEVADSELGIINTSYQFIALDAQ